MRGLGPKLGPSVFYAGIVAGPPMLGAGTGVRRSTYPEVFGGFFTAVGHDFVAYLRAFIQTAQTCSLDGRDMDEHVFAASVGLNKSIALCRD